MTQVKYFHAEQVGAPTLNGVQGTLINLLDACLVNGFGLKAVDSLVVAGNVATVTVTTGHSMQPDMVALIEGATPAGLNGEKRVIAASSTTFTFAAPGISDQTATGTITTKVAPLGWEKVFSATNVAVYRASSVEGTRMFYRFDETGDARGARVRGYETMSDASTGTNPFPSTAQHPDALNWMKAGTADSSPRDWTIIGDHRTIYFHANGLSQAGFPTSFRNNGIVLALGDYKPFKPGNPYAAVLHGVGSGLYASNGAHAGCMEIANRTHAFNSRVYGPRNYTGVASAVMLSYRYESMFDDAATSGQVAYFAYPNGPDNGLILTRCQYGSESSTNVFHAEGRTRGIYRIPQNCHAAFTQRAKIDGTGELTGRKLLVVKCGDWYRADISYGMVVFDITGPWEA